MTDSTPDQDRSVESTRQRPLRPEVVAASLRHKTSTLVQHSDLLAAELEHSEENDQEQLDTAWAMAEILTAANNLLETATKIESERVEE